MAWTITHDGTTKTLAEWGVQGLTRELVSQAVDQLSFALPDDFDADVPFAYGDILELKKDGVRWFYGRVATVPRQAQGAEESRGYTVAGPWWWLENIVFQQDWLIGDGAGATTLVKKSRAILSQDIDGDKLNTGEVIAEALDYAIARGAPIVKGSIDPALTVPYQEVKDLTVADVVRLVLRWSPDVVTYIDYTTTTPTLHVRKKENLSPASFAFTQDPIQSFAATPRSDLVPPSVALKFEILNTVGDDQWTDMVTQIAPDEASGLEVGALVATIELQGVRGSKQQQAVETQPLDPTSKAWWISKVPSLTEGDFVHVGNWNYAGLQFKNPTVTNESGTPVSWPREIIDGAVPEWRSDDAERVTVAADVTYMRADGNGKRTLVEDEPMKVKCTATDLYSKTYVRVTTEDAGEPVPEGLAQSIYDSVSVLHYEGQMSLVSDELVEPGYLGKVINVSGGRAEWASMAALVQTVTEDIDNGTVSIRFGPAAHLSPQDLVALLRANREAVRSTRNAERITAKPAEKNTVKGVTRTPNESPVRELDTVARPRDVRHSLDEIYGVKLKLTQSEDLEDLPQDLTGQWRKFTICDNGVEKTVLLLATEPYDDI